MMRICWSCICKWGLVSYWPETDALPLVNWNIKIALSPSVLWRVLNSRVHACGSVHYSGRQQCRIERLVVERFKFLSLKSFMVGHDVCFSKIQRLQFSANKFKSATPPYKESLIDTRHTSYSMQSQKFLPHLVGSSKKKNYNCLMTCENNEDNTREVWITLH